MSSQIWVVRAFLLFWSLTLKFTNFFFISDNILHKNKTTHRIISAIYTFKWQNSYVFPADISEIKLGLGIYHYRPIKMANISTTEDSECWQNHGAPTLWKSLQKNGQRLLKLNKVIPSFAEYLTESYIYMNTKRHKRLHSFTRGNTKLKTIQVFKGSPQAKSSLWIIF